MSDLVGLLTPLLWHTARSQGLDAGSAEDVVQTAWLRLYQHASSISDPQAILKWIVTTTRREAWSVSRAGRRADLVAEPAVDLDRATPPSDAPDATVLRGETQRMLWRHLKLLPERCQALLRVIAVADRPDYAAIAESLGMPVGSIGPTRGRCLAKLRAALESDPAWGVTA
jgi:RNA polymerase sigma factor (sigma-70 family)